jgi:hypothetical protein
MRVAVRVLELQRMGFEMQVLSAAGTRGSVSFAATDVDNSGPIGLSFTQGSPNWYVSD